MTYCSSFHHSNPSSTRRSSTLPVPFLSSPRRSPRYPPARSSRPDSRRRHSQLQVGRVSSAHRLLHRGIQVLRRSAQEVFGSLHMRVSLSLFPYFPRASGLLPSLRAVSDPPISSRSSVEVRFALDFCPLLAQADRLLACLLQSAASPSTPLKSPPLTSPRPPGFVPFANATLPPRVPARCASLSSPRSSLSPLPPSTLPLPTKLLPRTPTTSSTTPPRLPTPCSSAPPQRPPTTSPTSQNASRTRRSSWAPSSSTSTRQRVQSRRLR